MVTPNVAETAVLDQAREETKSENILRAFEDVASAGKTVDEIAADNSFEGVANGDADGSWNGSGGGDVDEKCSGQNCGPHAVTKNKEGSESDSGAGPYGACAGMNGGQFQAQLSGDKVDSGYGGKNRQISEKS